jgi:transcriptional regulator with XRE-family HTH domain
VPATVINYDFVQSGNSSYRPRSGLNHSFLSKLEKGASYPGLEIIPKLATVPEIEPAELLRVPLAPRSTSPVVSWVALRPMVGALAVIVRWRDELTQLED